MTGEPRARGDRAISLVRQGGIAWYEARHSLWTICRTMPVILLCFVAMIGCVRSAQEPLGEGAALVVGWSACLVVFVSLTLDMWRRDDRFAGSTAASGVRRS